MIKNVVFDFGQVLVHFEPEYMVRQYVSNEEDVKLLKDVIFDRLYWDKLDLGTITDEETIAQVKERIPKRLWDVAEKIHWNWIYNIPEIDGMKELVLHLKNDHRVGLFLLSNISKYFAEHQGEIPILSHFDGLVLTGPIGIVKPTREIFAYLCEKFDLNPDETIFIDDNENNIKGASAFGIHTYHFDGDVQKLRKYLDEILA